MEISWGQRMFGWDTPEWLEAINAQGETNLHNIWLFQGRRLDGSDMSFLELMLNTNRLLQAFSMLYCVIVPLAHHLSPRLARTIAWFGVPVPPLALGAMFVVSYAAFRIAVAFAGSWSVIRALNELKETNAAILFLLIAFYFALKRRSESPAAP